MPHNQIAPAPTDETETLRLSSEDENGAVLGAENGSKVGSLQDPSQQQAWQGDMPPGKSYVVTQAEKQEEPDDALVLSFFVKTENARAKSKLKKKPGSGTMWDGLNNSSTSLPMSPLNRFFTPIAESQAMEIVILLCIIINTGILAIQHTGNTKPVTWRGSGADYSQEFNDVMDTLDLTLTIIFTVEMFIRIFATGFYAGGTQFVNGSAIVRKSYISDAWNRLDFTVVLISWFSFIVDKAKVELPIKVSTLKALRILRVLKSLRYIKGIQVILVTLGKSAAAMTTILGFLAFVFTIAGIVGVQMFRGNMKWRCSKIAPEPDASGYDWIAMGIGDFTYRKHCAPMLDNAFAPPRPFPLCPEYPPCNIHWDDSMNPVYSNAEAWSVNVTLHDTILAHGDQFWEGETPVQGWVRRHDRANAREPKLAYSDDIVRVSSFSIKTPSIAANQSNATRCPPCYKASACEADELCYEFGNPGFGHHGFDNIVMSWVTVFIEMANLYWWETGYRVYDADVGLASDISWEFGFIIVLVLSMISVNMFVAVICDTFGDVRGEEGIKTFLGRETRVQLRVKAQPGQDGEDEELENIKLNGSDNCEEIKVKIGDAYTWDDGSDVKAYDLSVWYGDPKYRRSKELDDNETVALYLAVENDRLLADEAKLAAASETMWSDPNPWIDIVYVGDDDDGNPRYEERKANIQLHRKPPWYHTRWLMKMIAPDTVAGTAFDNFIMSFILLNTITLAAEHYGQSDDFTYVLEYSGHVFNLVFTGEMFAKIFGMGFRNYLAVPFNRLDFFIVMSGALDYLKAIIGDVLPVDPSVARLLRIGRLFRVARVVRILVKYESMRRLLNTVMGSGVALLNLTLFILFTVTIFAIFGMHLFGDWELVNPELQIPRRNFQNFGRAWLMAFQTLTGDDWCNQMYQYMNQADFFFPVLVYAMCFVSTNYVLMNLFIAVILENFEIAEEAKKDKQYAELLEWQRLQLEKKIAQAQARFTKEEIVEVKAPLVTVAPNGCADPCRNAVLWCCRGFRLNDCKKKSANEQRAAEENPEDRSKFCCHGPKKMCAIAAENDVALFCLHGETAERTFRYQDEYGKWQEEKEIYYTQPIRRFFQAIERNAWFERTVMVAIMVSSVLLAYEGPENATERNLGYAEDLDTCVDMVEEMCPAGSMAGFPTRVTEATVQDCWCSYSEKSLAGLEFMDGIQITDVLQVLDTTFFCVFMFEFITKLFNHGFYFTPDSYLADGWNRLDFVVVVFSTMNYIPGQGKSSLGRVFRLGRCLRPLRMVNKNPGLKVIVTAVIDSLGTNLAVMGLAGMLFLIFGILGCNLFGGKFWYCTCPDQVGPIRVEDGQTIGVWPAGDQVFDHLGLPRDGMNDRLLCLAATYYDDRLGEEMPCEWRNKPYNYDNIGEAMMAMFTGATLAGWTDIMEASLDTTGIDQHPIEMASPLAAVYWVFFVFLLAFFITNLFVGVLVDFIAQSDGSALQTEEQQKWTDLQRNIKELKPSAATPIPPKDPIRLASLKLVTSNAWEQTSNICIISNVLVMCLEFENQPLWYGEAMEIINNAFLIFFTVEMVLKLVGMGLSRYWDDAWNKFDAIVVCSSWGGMILNIQVQVARAFRAFRIVLVLKNAAGLQALFKCLIWAIIPSMNIGALLFLQFSLFAILGMQVFGDAGPHFDEVPRILPNSAGNLGAHRAYRLAEFGQVQTSMHTNFKTFFGSMKLLTECASGKDWKIVMYEIYDVVPGFAFFYFFLHYFFCVYILCNLFVAVIIDQYGSSKRELPVSRKNMEVFQNLWKSHIINLRNIDDGSGKLFDNLRARSNHTGTEFMVGGDDFCNLRKLLQDVGRMKGQSEENVRQEKVRAKFKDLEELVVRCDFEGARSTLDRLEEDKEVVKRLLSETISVWEIMTRATDLETDIEGLGCTEKELNEWDSGNLCPHPEPPPMTEAEKEEQRKKKIEQLTWDEWWERDDPKRPGEKCGFVVELKKRIRAGDNGYKDTQSSSGVLCCKRTASSEKLMHLKPVSYNAVLEALILTNMGTDALSKEEKLEAQAAEREQDVEKLFQEWLRVRQDSAIKKLQKAMKRRRMVLQLANAATGAAKKEGT
eukprot:SAG11_NODE_347_length_10420_cov_5.267997_2_plen_2091_part_00